MVTVALLEGDDDIAAAVAVDAAIKSALRRNAVRPQAADSAIEQLIHDACSRAAVDLRQIQRFVRVGSEDRRRRYQGAGLPPATVVDPAEATTCIVATMAADESGLVVLDSRHGSALGGRRDGTAHVAQPLVGIERLEDAARDLARALGAPAREPFRDLEQLAHLPDERALDYQRALFLDSRGVIQYVEEEAAAIVAAAQKNALGGLSDPRSLHTSVERERSALAHGFFARLTALCAELADRCREATGSSRVTFGGGFLGSVELPSRLSHQQWADRIVPLPQGLAAVLGAALTGHRNPSRLDHLALGCRFDDQEIKEVLDNCRLEYVYEPDWSRLFERVSRWLSGGSTVAWFQGSQDFHRESLGSRSVLADPSNRYARENVNRFLLGRPLASRLTISLAPSAARAVIGEARTMTVLPVLAAVASDARPLLMAGLDEESRGLVHVPVAGTSELAGLLESHRGRTGVPGLLNATLEAPAGGPAETPRDAVRAVFGSAVDALVIGRFLIAKDYWLMRQPAD